MSDLRADEAFFHPLDDDRYEATPLTLGPWGGGTQHAGPPSALLGRAVERHEPRDGFLVGRITLDILRPIPVGVLSVRTSTIRSGRHVDLVAATLAAGDTELVRAHAWRVRRQRDGVQAGDSEPAMPGPEAGEPKPFFAVGLDVGYHTAMEWRFVEGAFLEPGPAKVWLRMRVPLIPGETPSPLQRVLCAADSGNGVSAELHAAQWLFINTDLTVHLRRPLDGEWVGLDARTVIESDGIGLAETVLHDLRGSVGRGAQALYVAPRPG